MATNNLIAFNLFFELIKNLTQRNYWCSEVRLCNSFYCLNIRIAGILKSEFSTEQWLEILFTITHDLTHEHVLKAKNCSIVFRCTELGWVTLRAPTLRRRKSMKFYSLGLERKEYLKQDLFLQWWWVDSRHCWRLREKQSVKLWLLQSYELYSLFYFPASTVRLTAIYRPPF